MNELTGNLARVLSRQGFSIREDVRLLDTDFDLVAEDDAKLLFVSIRSSNNALLDDFANHQATIATLLSKVPLGRKWRDVYLLEITTDPIDTSAELEIVESVQSDTSTARKLILDASATDPTDEQAVEALISQVLEPSLAGTPYQDENLLTLLARNLTDDGFEPHLVERLLDSFNESGHSCVDIVLEEQRETR